MSGKNLVIVESPAKAHTINAYLGRDYVVAASMGHVRDLPKSKLGIDVEKGFEPSYIPLRDKSAVVKKLKGLAKDAKVIYLATDLDREGEAIAWHLAEILGGPPERMRRVVFNAITEKSIKEAFRQPLTLDMNKVNAQQARRLLDRLVGYMLSPLLWEKVARGLSAGRVQSVAVRLIADREKEIRAFKPEEFWRVAAKLAKAGDGEVTADLEQVDGQPVKIQNEAAAKAVEAELKALPFTVAKVEAQEKEKKPWPPLTTSLLQQAASVEFGYPAKRTMRIAQQLYEGLDVGSEGPVGLITYMRTDSLNFSEEALVEIRDHIGKTCPAPYLPAKPNVYRSRARTQGAHEAIRPTSVFRTPEEMKKFLTAEQYKLYELIWRRAVASQMTPERYLATTVDIAAGKYLFRLKGRKVIFDGFTRLYGGDREDAEQILPTLAEGETLALREVALAQSFTKPPPRYTEAALIKVLEKEGIGRPSTYAPIISTIQDRGYVQLKERAFHATELGEIVTDMLLEHFPDIMNVEFTSEMEALLDKVEDEGADWRQILSSFYQPFEYCVKKAKLGMTRMKGQVDAEGRVCETCGKPLLVRIGRFGKFLACPGFPDCKFTKSLDEKTEGAGAPPEPTDEKCPACAGPMVIRHGRNGKFLACTAYPKCKTTRSPPTGVKCPTCGTGDVVRRFSKKKGRRPFFGRNRYPDCDFTASRLDIPEAAKEVAKKGVS